MFADLESARSILYWAAWAQDHADEKEAAFSASVAKAYCSEAFTHNAANGIRLTEPLAPDMGSIEDFRQKHLLLFFTASSNYCRNGHAMGDDPRKSQFDTGGGTTLQDDDFLFWQYFF